MRNIAFLLLVPIMVSMFSTNPQGTSYTGDFFPAHEIEFLYDLRYEDEQGELQHEASILDKQLAAIEAAEAFIVADFFLFNDNYDRSGPEYPALSMQMTNALIEKQRKNPQIEIVFITDPINNFYGAYEHELFQRMDEEGIEVVITDLDKMKDSNATVSGPYKRYFKKFGTSGLGWIQNPFDPEGPAVNVRSVIKLANFKGNHRKVLITEKEAIISSANIHDASGYHSNVAVRLTGPLIWDVLESEGAVPAFSGGAYVSDTAKQRGRGIYAEATYNQGPLAETEVRLVTELSIFEAMREGIESLEEGDRISVGIFYISDFDVVRLLGEAAERGVEVRIIADSNKDAFGFEKDGSPNRTVLSRLTDVSENIKVRWYSTNGEQYHSKFILLESGTEDRLIIGSANFTRRNLKGYNLETDLEIRADKGSVFFQEVKAYYERIWNNEQGLYTLDFETYYDDSNFMYVKYLIQESSGLGTY